MDCDFLIASDIIVASVKTGWWGVQHRERSTCSTAASESHGVLRTQGEAH